VYSVLVYVLTLWVLHEIQFLPLCPLSLFITVPCKLKDLCGGIINAIKTILPGELGCLIIRVGIRLDRTDRFGSLAIEIFGYPKSKTDQSS
jgi:hypothetical protein